MSSAKIGASLPRKEGRDKVTGNTMYVDDVVLPDMIHGTTIRSSIPRGKIKNITFTEGEIPWDEFTVVTAEDIAGDNVVALIEDDQPYLAAKQVNHAEEPILLLAHPNKHLLERARNFVDIEYEEQPSLFSIPESRSKQQVIWGEDNVFKRFRINKGDVDSIWDKADFVVEGEYETGAQEQLYIENNGIIGEFSETDGVTVTGSMQCPYYIHKALVRLFNLPDEKVRVVQSATGGGFGGKEEYPSVIAGHAALLAKKAGRPVKIMYDRAEDLAATTKRHPSITKHRTAVSKDGKLLAMAIDFAIDGGAYATLSSVVLSRGTIHAAGPYHCPHIRIESQALATNTPPHGAFRGFGAPQSIFALERHMDKIANVVGLSPEELRRRNFLEDGMSTATNQIVKDGIDMNRLLGKAMDYSQYLEKRQQFAKHNQGKSKIKKGIGLATFMHGAGFTGSGERHLASVVSVEATPEGRVQVLASSTEIGQGTNTIFTQIACEALGVSASIIDVVQPDTHRVPNSGPTVASRTCMVVGQLVGDACRELLARLQKADLLPASEKVNDELFQKATSAFIEKHGSLKIDSQYKQPEGIFWNDETYEGEAYATYAWAVYIAEVSVDTVTFDVTVDDFVAMQDVGKVVNPVMAEGQIEGGVAQGIGFAIYEKVVWQEGRMANNRLTNYIVPTPADVPDIRVYFDEQPSVHGPGGAKGIGELPLDGSGPAVINAIEHATGIELNRMPLLPEDLFVAFKENR